MIQLSFENIQFCYKGGKDLFSGLNLQLKAGEFLCLLGPSGCGKSTLLRLAMGLEHPSQGSVAVPGGNLGIVFQEHRLLPWLTIEENLRLPRDLRGTPTAKEDVSTLLRLCRLDPELAYKFPSELSGGMRMRAAVARALLSGPKILLLDEPLAALDEPTRRALQIELRGLFERTPGVGYLMVTHSISEAVFLSSRVVLLNHDGTLKTELEIPGPLIRGKEWMFSSEAFELIQKIAGELE